MALEHIPTMGATDQVYSTNQDITQSAAFNQSTRSANHRETVTIPVSPDLVSSIYATPVESNSPIPSLQLREEAGSSTDSESEDDLDTSGDHKTSDKRMIENNVFAN